MKEEGALERERLHEEDLKERSPEEEVQSMEMTVHEAYKNDDNEEGVFNLYSEIKDAPISSPFITSAGEMIRHVLKNSPQLFDLGIQDGHEEWALRVRPFMADKRGFLISVNWIGNNLLPSSRMNNTIHSYGLKHLMERDIKRYVTNGMFICAMLAERYKMKRQGEGPNTCFNLSVKKLEILKRD